MIRLAPLLLLCACVPALVETKPDYSPQSQRIALTLPTGWMQANKDPELLMTRDGWDLERIFTNAAKFGEPLPHSKKAAARGMLPEEAAEVLRDELSATARGLGISFLENAPATVGGRPGFKLTWVFKTADNLEMKGITYGVLADDALVGLSYAAPARYYFDRYLPVFEKIRESLRITAASRGSSASAAANAR